jgi:hypothetical protein
MAGEPRGWNRRQALGGVALPWLAGALPGCASGPSPGAPPGPAWADALYAPALPSPDRGSIFGWSPAMENHVQTEVWPRARQLGTPRALYESLYETGQLRLAYDASHTRTAQQAFEDRAGNCLSLVVMTAAFAHRLGLTVRYQDMDVFVWERREPQAVQLRIGHVNILLSRQEPLSAERQAVTRWLLIDFMGRPDRAPATGLPIDEARVVAMWLNNRAAEALLAGDLRQGYWLAKAALQADPALGLAWNTLGVVHSRRGARAEADAAWQQALQRAESRDAARSNLDGARLAGQGEDALERRRAPSQDSRVPGPTKSL